jgi:two-component system LytT family response regulator
MDTKIRCILVDDELPGLDYLRMLCSQIPIVEVIKCFNSSEALLAEASSLSFDLCLLDIQMPGFNGMQVAHILGKPVIFISAHSQFAADAFDIEAIDFLRKPVSKERLEKAINKAYTQFKDKIPAKNFYTFNTQKGKSIIYFDNILFITTAEDEKRDKIAYLSDGALLTLKNITLDNLLRIFPSNQFCQVNKREIVSIKAIEYINNDEIVLKVKNENNLPVQVFLGEAFKQGFLQLVNNQNPV